MNKAQLQSDNVKRAFWLSPKSIKNIMFVNSKFMLKKRRVYNLQLQNQTNISLLKGRQNLANRKYFELIVFYLEDNESNFIKMKIVNKRREGFTSPRHQMIDNFINKTNDLWEWQNSKDIWRAIHSKICDDIKTKVDKAKEIKFGQLKAFSKFRRQLDFRSMSPKSRLTIQNLDKSIEDGQYVNSQYFMDYNQKYGKEMKDQALPLLSAPRLKSRCWNSPLFQTKTLFSSKQLVS